DAEAEWRRLTWYGARRWQLVLVSAAEVVAVALVGAAIGWAVGTGIGAFVAGRADVPAGAILAHSTLAGRGFVFAAAIAVAASLVVLLSLRAGAARLGALTVTPVDAAAAGALVAVVIALARGAANASTLANEQGTGAVLLVLPALIAFVAAVVVARVLAPGLGLLERWGRSGPAPLRLAALSLARHPGRAAVAVAFLVVSLGLALFAEAYRATLVRGQNDQASFAAPVDDIVGEDLTKLIPVFQTAPLPRFAAAVPGTRAFAVVRQSGNVRRLEGTEGVTVLGVPASQLTTLRWRHDNAFDSLGTLQNLLRPETPVVLRGAAIPANAHELVLPLRARGDELAVRAIVLRLGHAYRIPLGTTTSRRLAAHIPAAGPGGILPIGVGSGTITGRVVATARRIPTIGGDAVLAEASTIAGALAADAPGAGAPNEAWLDAPRGAAARLDGALLRPPFDVLAVTSRRELLADLRSEPLARGTLLTLTGAALVALGLALVGLMLGVVS